MSIQTPSFQNSSAPQRHVAPVFPKLFPELFRDDALRLETRRLWLRWPSARDAAALHEIASLEAVARQTATWPHPFPDDEAAKRIAHAHTVNAAGTGLRLALTPKSEPGRLIGLVGVDRDGESDDLILGYLLGVEHQGYGLMTEAVRAVVNAVFRYTPFTVIRGAAGATNHASRRVMEKAGFRITRQFAHPAPAQGAAVTCDEFELVRADWRMRPCLTVRPLADQHAVAVPCDRAA